MGGGRSLRSGRTFARVRYMHRGSCVHASRYTWIVCTYMYITVHMDLVYIHHGTHGSGVHALWYTWIMCIMVHMDRVYISHGTHGSGQEPVVLLIWCTRIMVHVCLDLASFLDARE